MEVEMRGVAIVALLVGCAPKTNEGPLEGPGVDEQGRITVEADELLVALTHLQVKNAPGPGKTFGGHANAVGTHLFETEPEGWVGVAFKNVGRLDWWTMTVWESEDAMLAFVVSNPHAAAMRDFEDIVVGGETRSLWMSAEELPLDWTTANELLLEEPDFTHGTTDWREGDL
jgi:hypothetical protein